MMYPGLGFDWTYLLILPGMLLSMYAQGKISSTYRTYSQMGNERNLTGAQIARYILDNAGLRNVPVEPVRGQLTDHYDPQNKVLRLSEGVHSSTSVAALGIAAHEVGHAIQDSSNYTPMRIRAMIVPLASIGGNISMLLLMLGFGSAYATGDNTFIKWGILLFSFTVLFQLVTLPVEFDASRRALKILNTGILNPEELNASKKVLSAAALTYVAAALTGILTLLSFIVRMGGTKRRRNDF